MKLVTTKIHQHNTDNSYELPSVNFFNLYEYHHYEHNMMQLSKLLRKDLYVSVTTTYIQEYTGEVLCEDTCEYQHGETYHILTEDQELPF